MTEHSPGPWTFDSEFSNSQDEIVDGEGRTICIVWTRRAIPGATARPQFKDVPNLMANRKLIEAAPDLLKALICTVESLEYWFPRWGDPGGCDSAMMMQARDAIKRATYEQPTEEESQP